MLYVNYISMKLGKVKIKDSNKTRQLFHLLFVGLGFPYGYSSSNRNFLARIFFF